MRRSIAVLCLLTYLVNICSSFYLPGVAPVQYKDGQEVMIYMNTLTSSKTQLPLDFYESLPFCRPHEFIEERENLGEVLFGERKESSYYALNVLRPEVCKPLPDQCNRHYDEDDIKKIADKIDDEYYVQMFLDSFPVATRDETFETDIYRLGFPLGALSREGDKYINNHLDFTVKYHTDPSYEGSRIVGFEVRARSVQHIVKDDGTVPTCNDQFDVNDMPPLPAKAGKIAWTYSINWEISNVKWASRWDVYLKIADSQIHWFSIVNSVMIVLFLSGMVAMIMMRTLHKDLQRYHELENSEEAQEETGWKLVHGDVFRAPTKSSILSALVGTGVQVLGMSVVTLVFAALGFLSPSNRGGLMTALLILFVFMGALAGYYSSRLYKSVKGQHFSVNWMMTALAFPGIIFVIYFVLDLFVWSQHSTRAVPFGTMVALIALWFFISVPLVYLGHYFGKKKEAIEFPVRTNQIPRQIPDQPWYMRPPVSVLMGGILPFGAVFIELFFILSSLWLNQFYYVFGFLFLVFIILVITCAEITVVMVYFQLCAEDYHWWWRSFMTAGSSALYLFLYSVFYFFTRLRIVKFVSGLLFFGYMTMISLFFFVLTGTIGFLACFWFVRKIYGSIKID